MKTEPPQPCLSSPARRVEDAVIVSHRQTAANTYRLRVECPGIAASAVAGQFAMLRILHIAQYVHAVCLTGIYCTV